MNKLELITNLLEQRHTMQLATIKNDQPWCSSVYYVIDSDLNIYWASLPTRRHSKEITNNSNVSAAIVIQSDIGKKVIGIQIEGNARKLQSTIKIIDITKKYAVKFNKSSQWISDFTSNKTDHKMYQLTPKTIVLFDEENYISSPRQEIVLIKPKC